LEFKAHDQVKTAIKSVDMYRLYNQKANRHKPEFGEKAIWMNISRHETSGNKGASAKSGIQLKICAESGSKRVPNKTYLMRY
jgi:hypothetical protein